MESYDHKTIEKKWQKYWEENNMYQASDDATDKTYLLVEFPYPSGDGLHTGHVRPYTGLDVIARKRRLEGKNVLYPIGWDAFGLPAENYAIKTGIHPAVVTKQNIANFKSQIKSLGISFDWSREINTTDPEYYKWTQWIFLKLFSEGLAYKTKMPVNWCLSCKVGLANEEVVDGKCERCGSETEKRDKEQWMLAITKYADRLHDDLGDVDYLEQIKLGQRNWIGRSHGAQISFDIKDTDKTIEVFTTRPDTLYGATYMVLAPEHELVRELSDTIENIDDVRHYIQEAASKTEIERTKEEKDKTGIELKGISAINPANGQSIPVFIADYVLAQYGTGAIMAVPAHDERDNAFAKKFELPIVEVVSNKADGVYTGTGKLQNSVEFDGMESEDAKQAITKKVHGEMKTTFKLRDWVFSRQRYWGEPIPIIHCESCGMVPVPEKDLPVLLPEVEKYQTNDEGESPLADIPEFVNVPCPKCGGDAKRETDTMPQWAGSSWYYLRYADPNNSQAFADEKNLKEWSPVDWYNGGMEHTTLHLLYSRFWHKFLFDQGLVPTSEPYAKRTAHGLILAEGGEKMSKSKGNVVNPNDVVEYVGADALRLYEMFMGPFDQAIAWDTNAIAGTRRFIERVYALRKNTSEEANNNEVMMLLHQTIKKVGEDIEATKFNTAVSQLMILVNALEKEEKVNTDVYKTLVQLLAPFCPHITDEIWAELGGQNSVHESVWPSFDESKLESDTVVIVVQINGKVRDKFEAARGATKEEIEREAHALPKVKTHVDGQKVAKNIYIQDKLLNVVLGVD